MSEGWLVKEYEEVQELKAKRREEQGLKDIMHLEKGDNQVIIDLITKPELVQTKFGARKCFDLVYPEGKILMLSPWTATDLVEFVHEQEGNPNVVIIKSGEGKATRYEFKTWKGTAPSTNSPEVKLKELEAMNK